jgi:hypothetical protein
LGLGFAVPPIADLINGENDLLPILGTEFKLAMNSGTIPSPSIGDIFTPWVLKIIITVARYTIVEVDVLVPLTEYVDGMEGFILSKWILVKSKN